ncbi:MAG TPA: trehalose-phosphatase, partial [Actinomycetota bacterium]|nr:trehalose-phosphatase [Actinomycetota bacterium]
MSDELLRPFLERPESAGIFLDFDGTLSEIVPIPADARPAPGATDLLTALARKFAVVAIVSGRSANELVQWLGPEVEIWGVHGAQRATNGTVELSPRAKPFEPQMKKVHEEATERIESAGLTGAIVEDKAVMVTLHYRAAEDPAEAKRALGSLAKELATKHDLTCVPGRASYELRPAIDFTKAAVIEDRSTNLEAVAFAGDDTVDLPGFDALDALSEQGVATLRIAVRSNEAPDALLNRADIVVDGPEGAVN